MKSVKIMIADCLQKEVYRLNNLVRGRQVVVKGKFRRN